MPNVLAISHKHQLYDIPNTRKIHHTPIPRLGGTTFLPVIIITVALMMGTRYFLGYDIINLPGRVVLIEFLFLLCASCMIYTVGIVDDLIGVSWKWKLLIQIICGLLLAISGLWIHNGCGLFGIFQIRAYIGIPLTIFFVVYMINAINLIDGVDGLASCLSGVSLIVLTHIFIQERQLIYALMSFSALGIIVPFACYNIFGSQKKRHKLFMGDTGTLSLGLILSFLTLRVLQTGATSTYSIENKLEIDNRQKSYHDLEYKKEVKKIIREMNIRNLKALDEQVKMGKQNVDHGMSELEKAMNRDILEKAYDME